ncbi:hypothetical protein [Actinomadura roseirufa]|uniref:hypothetical protein n=1 Tax=Actinomadura roseirufa TaxID=2094049 RepID=UPI00104141F4|nr:hypothetical protein [Actinomadura roseirufa]
MSVGAEGESAAASSASTAYRSQGSVVTLWPVRSPERLDVEDVGGVYFLVDPQTRDIRGTLVDLGGGWWRCRTPRGDAREVFVPPWVDEPWRDVAERTAA